MNLLDPIHNLKGIGPKTESCFQQINIHTYFDLLTFFPKTYEHYSFVHKTAQSIENNTMVAIECRITSVSNIYRNSKSVTQIKGISVAGENIACVFFHMPFLKKTIHINTKQIIFGKVTIKNKVLHFIQPKLFHLEKYQKIENTYQPKYAYIKGLTNQTMIKLIKQILSTNDLQIPDFLAENIQKQESFLSLKEAIYEIHFPANTISLKQARKRLVFNEFFFYLYKLNQSKRQNVRILNTTPMLKVAETTRFMETLPFSLTVDQLSAWEDIQNDLSGKYQMNRLLQGDVGSGKTILAILAIFMCISNRYQSAFMAPLEILAEQHFETINEYIKTYKISNATPCLLTSSVSKSAKQKIYEEIKNGSINIIIGTHALLQESLEFKHLGLVITDEQHRFGVKQRNALSGKGINTNTLVMSATPIPRSLAIILYGDLKVSKIKMLPKGRLPIKNSVITPAFRMKAHSFIQKQIACNHQAYIICPMVEFSEEMPQLHSVIEYTEELKHLFPKHIHIASIHGKMKPTEKIAIMAAFKRKEIDILVATTVIEVGINVPNATVMLIENAERFGLATLHQLRGRIGRGSEQSYCMFLCESESDNAKKRLEILLHSNDGFHIANEDLKLRGPGNMLGIEQSGSLHFAIGDIYDNQSELVVAKNLVNEINKGTFVLNDEEQNILDFYITNTSNINTYENIL